MTEPRPDILDWMLEIDKASAVMASDAGLITREEARTAALAVRRVESDARVAGAVRPTDYLDVQPLLRAHGGAAVDGIHLGRSRQDILATVHRLRLRAAVAREVLPGTLALRAALIDVASRHLDVVIPAYTNGVQAQPTTVGHMMLGFEAAMARSTARLLDSYHRIDRCPLGASALATSSFPVDRPRLALLLGFAGVEENSFDAAQLAMTDVGFEAGAGAMALALTAGTLVQDLHAQYHHVRPWFLLEGSGMIAPSTLMPQKRNPVALNRVRLLASEVVGDGVTTAFAAHNVASGLTDPKRGDAVATLERASALLAEVTGVVRSLHVDADAALDQVRADWSTSSELANEMYRAGVPFAEAHRFVAAVVADARADGVGPAMIEVDRVRAAWTTAHPFPLAEEAIRRALDPVAMVDAQRGRGGPQKIERERMLSDAGARLSADRQRIEEIGDSLSRAAAARDAAFTALVEGV